ncbi:MAG: cytidyltransferase [Flavobacteriaceae bacterium]|nr:cytidyltransferase [Flavobacteriaceae bacterium]|tara:strand:- start:4243 stop:4956 length:714 start_codon:yes stop_codon:yes gene_type:complete
MNFLITICARGGSKGLKEKNIKKINNIPLIKYTIDIAKLFSSKYNSVIALSTDSLKIKGLCESFGLNTEYIRPTRLGEDNIGKLDVIYDVLQYQEKKLKKNFDLILDLDVTSPLRNINDLDMALSLLNNDSDALNIFSVNESQRNPYFNMVEKKSNGYYGLVKDGAFLTRQSTPKVYDLNASFYFFKRNFFNVGHKTTISNKSLIYTMPHICFDIDNQADFDYMEYLLKNNKLNFKL